MASAVTTTAAILPAAVDGFPAFERFTLRFPIRAADMTIWPDEVQSRVEYAIGHPLELSPFTWDYLAASCDGQRLAIEPHYNLSTWDTFWVDVRGVVVVQAFRGAFPYTFGCQARLLEGICSVVATLQGVVDDGQVSAALTVIHGRLRERVLHPGPGPMMVVPPQSFLRRLFWGFKLCAWRPAPTRSGN